MGEHREEKGPHHAPAEQAGLEEGPSGVAQPGCETPPLGVENAAPEGEGEPRRGERAMPGIPTEGEPDSSA